LGYRHRHWVGDGRCHHQHDLRGHEQRGSAFLSFENLALKHIGWGLRRDESADFQSASFFDTAAVHLHNTSRVLLRNVSVRHAGGYAVWVESSSEDVQIDGADIRDGSGGVRVGRGKPLSAEPPNARTQRVRIYNSRILGGALVYTARLPACSCSTRMK